MSKLYIFKTVGIPLYSCIPFKKALRKQHMSMYTYTPINL